MEVGQSNFPGRIVLAAAAAAALPYATTTTILTTSFLAQTSKCCSSLLLLYYYTTTTNVGLALGPCISSTGTGSVSDYSHSNCNWKNLACFEQAWWMNLEQHSVMLWLISPHLSTLIACLLFRL